MNKTNFVTVSFGDDPTALTIVVVFFYVNTKSRLVH